MKNDFEIPLPPKLEKAPALNWGIIGPGWIAGKFVSALHKHSAQRVLAVSSRSRARAEKFALGTGIGRAYGSHKELLADPNIEVIYIAAPNVFHAELAVSAINAGKHVLIEKPFATSADEGRLIVAAARSAGVLVMEAMWTHYLPQMTVMKEVLKSGAIGDISIVAADFGFSASRDLHARLFDSSQAGGALLDAGIYPLSFAVSVLGPPRTVTAVGQVAETGVETDAALSLDHGSGRSVVLTSIEAHLPVRASVMGTEGYIDLISPFIGPSGIRVVKNGKSPWTVETTTWTDNTLPDFYDGLHYQADALARFVHDGRLESPVHPLKETMSALETIDLAKAQIGTFLVD